jgi:hypothetical protein
VKERLCFNSPLIQRKAVKEKAVFLPSPLIQRKVVKEQAAF